MLQNPPRSRAEALAIAAILMQLSTDIVPFSSFPARL